MYSLMVGMFAIEYILMGTSYGLLESEEAARAG